MTLLSTLEKTMAGSCCGGASKSESAKIVIAPGAKTTEVAADPQAAKGECCNDKSAAKNEKHSCGC